MTDSRPVGTLLHTDLPDGTREYRNRTAPYPPYDDIDYLFAQGMDSMLRRAGLPDCIHTDLTARRLIHYITHLYEPMLMPRVTVFPNCNPKVDQLVVVPNIDFWSACSHHLLPFVGKVTIGYIPNGVLIGLSKIPLIVRAIARHPTLQEHLADEIADYIQDQTSPHGVAVHIRAQHTCQLLDLGQPPIPIMTTTVLRGRLKRHPARSEFLKEVQP